MMNPNLVGLARSARRGWTIVFASGLLWSLQADHELAGRSVAAAEPAWFERFLPPDEWQARFWASPDAQALGKLDRQALVDLVPRQAGFRYCRCPACGAAETTDPLAWSIRKPEIVTCRKCDASFPNDSVPARDKDKKIPEDSVEVAPGVSHKYPYHVPEADAQQEPDEHLYLSARRDYEAREYLAKAAFYAASRSQSASDPERRHADAAIASVLILRFAQVYPRYALHLDQPGRSKSLEPASQPPPYRRGYMTGKWDWTGSLDVPVNLVLAYALIRHDPAVAEAGRLLHDPHPTRTIEENLFLASATFTRNQPEEVSEQALQVDRGLLLVGRLLENQDMVVEATRRLDRLAERGFFYDGLWRGGDAPTHQRVLSLLDGWIGRLLETGAGTSSLVGRSGQSLSGRSGADLIPMVALARTAGASATLEAPAAEVQRVAWPSPRPWTESRQPALLGGSGVARLGVGQGADALDVELRGMGSFGSPRSRRQALRVAVGGRTLLGDLDDGPPCPDGWDRASASHNTVIINELNQRETPKLMREPAAGGDFLFFAADPDFQVVVQDDPRAYPRTTSAGGYRQTVVVCSGAKTRYAVSVFEVKGGARHDQLFHGPVAATGEWLASVPTKPSPNSLLTAAIPFIGTAQANDGRWFVQAYGEFARIKRGLANHASVAEWHDEGRSPLRLHLLDDAPYEVITAQSPPEPNQGKPFRSSLLIRRQLAKGDILESTFVTVFDPTLGDSRAGNLTRAGRMNATPGFVVLYLETPDDPEHLVINLQPGTLRKTQLADGRDLATDGRVVRARRDELMMAGGSVASLGGVVVRQPVLTGKILSATRFGSTESRGWFETDAELPGGSNLVGRTLIIRHGDGTTHGWTLQQVEPLANHRIRLHVREEPGFTITGKDRHADYYQFPATTSPGPHTFRIATIAR